MKKYVVVVLLLLSLNAYSSEKTLECQVRALTKPSTAEGTTVRFTIMDGGKAIIGLTEGPVPLHTTSTTYRWEIKGDDRFVLIHHLNRDSGAYQLLGKSSEGATQLLTGTCRRPQPKL